MIVFTLLLSEPEIESNRTIAVDMDLVHTLEKIRFLRAENKENLFTAILGSTNKSYGQI